MSWLSQGDPNKRKGLVMMGVLYRAARSGARRRLPEAIIAVI